MLRERWTDSKKLPTNVLNYLQSIRQKLVVASSRRLKLKQNPRSVMTEAPETIHCRRGMKCFSSTWKDPEAGRLP